MYEQSQWRVRVGYRQTNGTQVGTAVIVTARDAHTAEVIVRARYTVRPEVAAFTNIAAEPFTDTDIYPIAG